jgi:hypothetical protein
MIIIMTISIIALSMAILQGCDEVVKDNNIDNAWTYHGMSCYTKVVEIEGHKYIIMDGSYSGNIIHAASCSCLNK